MASTVLRKGNQTPTKHVHDPEALSLMDSPTFASRFASFDLHPIKWQRLVLHDAFAVNELALPRYRTVCLAVPRQNGKSEVIIDYMLMKVTIFGHSGAYTSYEKESAHEIYERMVTHIRETPRLRVYFPKLPTTTLKNDLKPLIAHHPKTGEFLGKISFYTRKGGTGRGKGFKWVIFDEANEMNFKEYNSLGATIAARKDGQLIFLGTPASLQTSATFGRGAGSSDGGKFFMGLRNRILAGDIGNAAWIEWGVDKITPITDREAWFRTNPSLNYDFGNGLGLFEADLESWAGENEEDFNVERLGYWAVQSKERAIDITRWRDLTIADHKQNVNSDSYLSIAVKSSFNQERVYVSTAVRRSDDKVFTEILKSFDTNSPWTDDLWKLIYPYLRSSACTSFYVDGELAKSALVQKMSDQGVWRVNGNAYRQGKTLMASSKDMSSSSSSFITAVRERRLVHGGQYELDVAVEDAKKREFRGASDGFAFESMSGLVDVTPLETVALAVGAVLRHSRPVEDIEDKTDGNDIAGKKQPAVSTSLAGMGQAKVFKGFGAFR